MNRLKALRHSHLASTSNMLRRAQPVRTHISWAFRLSLSSLSPSPREAIECFKRALLGAEPTESNIKLKLARLYDDLGDKASAAAYHRRIAENELAETKGFPLSSCRLVTSHRISF